MAFGARSAPGAANEKRGGRWWGCAGARPTSNWEKSEKKNETVRFFCTSLRASGSLGLSLPIPNFDEQNFPAHAGEALAAHTPSGGAALQRRGRLRVGGRA